MRSTSLPRLVCMFAMFVTGIAGIGVPVALAAVQNRINVTIPNGSPDEIPNSVHPRVGRATDLGPMRPETKLVMTLHFSMTAEQDAALDQLMADQQNPSSPRYHQWLTPAQYAAQFGLSSADLAKVHAWLSGQGFTVTGVADGTVVSFDGTVAQAQAAFGTSIHSLSVNGEVHFANVTNAAVPRTLSGVVDAITGLHDFRLKPRSHIGVANPRFTSSVSGNHYLAPADLYTIYDVTPLLNSGINGTGITIGVLGQVAISTADVTAFRSAAGLSTINLPTTVHEGTDPGSPTCSDKSCTPNNGDVAESSLDVEWAGAMAPSANILFINGKDVLFNSMTQAILQNLAPILTLSYGNCEAAWGSTDIVYFNGLLKQANAQGQTILAATGDVGATDCDSGTPAKEGLTVDFPASSPYVTGMGGTQFNETLTGATVWGTTNGSTGGSALSYIPEAAWNEDSSGSALSSGGGGISSFFTKPAWQIETGPAIVGPTTQVPPDASRDVPDIALDAAAGHDQFLYCALSSCVVGFRASASGNLTVAGGTSFDSQLFGGMLALIEQKIGSRIGNANPTLYALGNNSLYYNTSSTSVFHDVQAGNNSSPCTAGTPNCPGGGTEGYNAATGYDLATGWGSVDLNNLANAWNQVIPLGVGSIGTTTSATSLVASSTSPAAGANVLLTATVTVASGTPTGTVQFLVNNAFAGGPVALMNGIATFTYVTSCSTLGQQMMSAAYSGDATYAGSKGPALALGSAGNAGGAGTTSNGSTIPTPLIVTVTSGTCPDFTLTPSQTAVTVAAGGTVPSVTITVAPLNSFTGTVSFAASATTTTAYLPTLAFSSSSVAITTSAVGTTSLSFTGINADLHTPKMPGRPAPAPWYAVGSGVTIASLLMFALPRKRRLGGLLALLLAVALVGGATGCGNSSQVVQAANPYAGTYVVTVVATYASAGKPTISHSTTITYQIN